jgi:hypothetical protein
MLLVGIVIRREFVECSRELDRPSSYIIRQDTYADPDAASGLSARGLRLRGRSVGRLIGYAGFGEGCHAAMTRQGRAQQEKRDGGAGRFAEPHIEIDEWMQAELVEQHPVPGLG